MNTEQLHALLGSLSGHLTTRSQQQEEELKRLRQSLSRSRLPEDPRQFKESSFTFEQADLFFAGDIPPASLDSLRAAEGEAASGDEPEFKVFVREVPVRSTQLHASVPLWAGGAAVDHTVGPLTHRDGRKLWFDFFRVEKLIALYVEGRPDPAVLFNVRVRKFFGVDLSLLADPASSYDLPVGSIWINSRLLAADAPPGYYTGLTVEAGAVRLSVAPQLVGGKLTIKPATVVSVDLRLRQAAVADDDDESPYGLDARRASLQLPERLSLRFSGAGGRVDEVSPATWDVYGHQASFHHDPQRTPRYHGLLHRILVPLACSAPDFRVHECRSPFLRLSGRAPIDAAAWALPSAPIDVQHPTPAAGIGALSIKCGKGLAASWQGLRGGELHAGGPYLLAEPGRIGLTDQKSANAFGEQTLELWKDEENTYGTNAQLRFPRPAPFFYNTLANGNEALVVLADADVRIDRPVTVAAEALAIRSKDSLLLLAVNKAMRLVYLLDDNILFDNSDFTQKVPVLPQPVALALRNALFKVTPANGCLLFGRLAEDFVKVERGSLFLTFGMYAYLPTLPDPYAANLGALKRQFRARREGLRERAVLGGQNIWLWLVCQIKWQHATEEYDGVEISFHFAPLQNQFQLSASASADAPTNTDAREAPPHPLFSLRAADTHIAADANTDFFERATGADSQVAADAFEASAPEAAGIRFAANFRRDRLPDYGAIWDQSTSNLRQDVFALLDVSTRADLLGISFGTFGDRRMAMFQTHAVAPADESPTGFPLQVQGMEVVSRGSNVRAFTVPQISWEPVLNLSEHHVAGDPSLGPNYYPDDGGPARLLNNSPQQVALAPIPLTNFLVSASADDDRFAALALFTLPFGIKALALLRKHYEYEGHRRKGSELHLNRKTFDDGVRGARQLEVNAGEALVEGESATFMGSTVQLNNVLELDGAPKGNSTLGGSVTEIFNNEFLLEPFDLLRQRGVPLTRIDLSGYGASIFSNWLNPKATIAATSQAKFDVFVGRCAHEVVQVKSIMYPWAIKVVRTITLFRAGSGYVYRYDSGWRAESAGVFDFAYYVNVPDGPGRLKPEARQADYEIHPGALRGLFNVREIIETEEVAKFTGQMAIAPGKTYVDEDGKEQTNTTKDALPFGYDLQPVFFNADVEIENPVSGHVTKIVEGQERKLVPSKHILGFVQLAPRGIPLTKEAFRDLLLRQGGTIGGPLDCVVDIAASGQRMRLGRFDVNNSVAADDSTPVFVAAARGSVILPKDGSWGMVKHLYGTGEVSPVSEDLSVPLIRIGQLVKKLNKLTQKFVWTLDKDPANELVRVADPLELLRQPVSATVNYGFLHSTDTQKALFLTPAYRQGLDRLLSKTPPLFADAFRIVSSKAVFPNAGNAADNFGDVISLVQTGAEFATNAAQDGGKNAFELAQIGKLAGNASELGFKLLKRVPEFILPQSADWTLIELGGSFRIYIKYRAENIQKPKRPDGTSGGTKTLDGKLDFDVDSFAADVADRWKSLMSGVSIIVDLGPIKRLMTIKGNWDAKKGVEAQYKGSDVDPDFSAPQIEFASELKPVIEILQILQDLQGENYKGALQRGLKLAMSNKAGTWEYKFEAAKEIPVLRFPVPDFLYNDPNAPLKLEAGLKLGAYFNAALKVTTDPKQLLPTAGGYFGFYGRLSVMCVSLSVATVYAIGQVNLDIGADTKVGPSLRMKFGFGAQIVVGLPVVGNVSVLYVVGVEIYADSTKLNLSAFLLFQGHAELLGGLVAVTITIEAKGTVSRANERTDLAAQVTFGLDISIFLVIDISFSTSWEEQRQIA